ncbi:ATP-binding protein [Actinomyces sp. zg328]|uniref:ATP-binding protein n=1 Tax=Actinomyces sp. zg328 TaxID=2609287 RepID=UPI001F1D3130|nr:ATP-binding protein [Actinomyces sp. zg328]
MPLAVDQAMSFLRKHAYKAALFGEVRRRDAYSVPVEPIREAGIVEQWGTGVRRVFAQVAQAGLPEPVIEEVRDRVRVTIYVPSHDPGRVGEHVSKSSEHVMVVLTAAGTPRSRSELLAAIGLADAYGNYRRHVLPLIERGYLARMIPGKLNSGLQRYRLTDAGRARRDGRSGHAE